MREEAVAEDPSPRSAAALRDPRSSCVPRPAGKGSRRAAGGVSPYGERNPFLYDYDTVRMMGMILAVVLACLGIVVALSNKLKCKKNNSNCSRMDDRQAGCSQTPASALSEGRGCCRTLEAARCS
ncbi:FXYD domain-containing ion transport regulator 7-like [Rhinatrema bivittatum]|uniref:FXYD domain-containing ion transport regulator 7-like n=1 Tax=Rhinatrema bivittatum TaxID=194408 RepID=UPI001125DB33|nr:FXYD domain-containing ion transport regulator 7-like [Rhinatrema bivittatum]